MSIIETFATTWNNLRADNLHTLAEVYHADAVFVDPFHQLHGFSAITEYMRHMYENVISAHFTFHASQRVGDEVFLRWTMTVSHRRLRNGEPIELPGVSYLKISADKVIFHQDYYDGGVLLYENIPLLGAAVRLVKRKAQG
jgi:ketosteroid isomerase-like protein